MSPGIFVPCHNINSPLQIVNKGFFNFQDLKEKDNNTTQFSFSSEATKNLQEDIHNIVKAWLSGQITRLEKEIETLLEQV